MPGLQIVDASMARSRQSAPPSPSRLGAHRVPRASRFARSARRDRVQTVTVFGRIGIAGKTMSRGGSSRTGRPTLAVDELRYADGGLPKADGRARRVSADARASCSLSRLSTGSGEGDGMISSARSTSREATIMASANDALSLVVASARYTCCNAEPTRCASSCESRQGSETSPTDSRAASSVSRSASARSPVTTPPRQLPELRPPNCAPANSVPGR